MNTLKFRACFRLVFMGLLTIMTYTNGAQALSAAYAVVVFVALLWFAVGSLVACIRQIDPRDSGWLLGPLAWPAYSLDD